MIAVSPWRLARPVSVMLLSATALMAGCSANLDKNPTILKQAKLVDELDRSVEDMDRCLAIVSADLQETSRDIAKMKATQGGVAPETVSALEQRVGGLEAALKAANKTIAGMDQTIKKQDQEMARMAKLADVERSRLAKDIKAAKQSGSSKDVARVVTKSSKASEKAAAPSKPAGTYYLVKAGDTLEKIASSHKTTVKKIASANRLPSSVNLPAGQRLYIPAK